MSNESARDRAKQKAWQEAWKSHGHTTPDFIPFTWGDPFDAGYSAGYADASPKWVRIEDGLPEVGVLVWITYVKHTKSSVAKATNKGVVWYNELGMAVIFPITAWQHIASYPEPYTEEPND